MQDVGACENRKTVDIDITYRVVLRNILKQKGNRNWLYNSKEV